MPGSPIRPICQPICRPIVRSINSLVGQSAASLPAGALGVWYASNYTASPRPYIPNEITKATNTPSANLFAASRRLFSNATLWSKTSITITDDAATAPDSSLEASTFTCTGNWLFKVASSTTVPAGTYTIAVNAKRNTGTDQQFCFSKDFLATRSPVKTATASWQRFSYTFTLASPSNITNIMICSIDGVTGADLQICDLEMYAGSSDLGPQTLAGHLYLGSSAYDSAPTYASGELNLSASGWGLVQLASNQTISNMTIIALTSKIAAGSNFNASLSKVQAFAEMTGMMEQSLLPQTYISNGTNYSQVANLWTFLNKGYHCFTHRYDGTSRDIFVDDVRIFQKAGSVSSFSLRDMFLGMVANTGNLSGHKFASVAFFNRALSDAEVRTAYSVLATRATGLGVTPQNRIYAADGDSITADAALISYAYRFGANASPSVIGGNFAVGGSTIASLVSRATVLDQALPTNRTGRKFILSIMIGRNDISALGTSTWLTNLATYLDARRAAGWTVVLCATLPSTAGGFNALRATTNATISTWVGTHCDAYVSFAGSTMEGDADASDVSKYYDGTHPTAAGHILLEPYLRTAINAL